MIRSLPDFDRRFLPKPDTADRRLFPAQDAARQLANQLVESIRQHLKSA